MSAPRPLNPAHARRRARRAAVQALYQWLVGGSALRQIEAQFREMQDQSRMDTAYFHELLHRIPAERDELEALLTPAVDRPLAEIDPVERAILYIGAYELRHRRDIPYRVVINEAVESAKTFGATESHRFINGVLDRAAREIRAAEVAVPRADGGKPDA